ncbi:MAG TPA: hypothetical protein VJ729_03075 [Nitrososphaeraceae archaeon]|nr:hypothetical protein [Nitrososphaeraceae archaeon]
MSESIHNKTILSDAIIVLANAFRESGYNPPSKIEVDSQTFDKILAKQWNYTI